MSLTNEGINNFLNSIYKRIKENGTFNFETPSQPFSAYPASITCEGDNIYTLVDRLTKRGFTFSTVDTFSKETDCTNVTLGQRSISQIVITKDSALKKFYTFVEMISKDPERERLMIADTWTDTCQW